MESFRNYHRKRQEKKQQRSSVQSGWKNISSTVLLIVAAPVLALFLTAHVFQSYEVDGRSMETTLQHGDRLIVNKLPKTISNIRNSTYLPNRWDVVVIDRPTKSNINSSVDHLIKRVIALPGERITVKDGRVTVYNQEFPDGFNPDKDQEYAKDISTTDRQVDITVGASEIFVMGDNRLNSTDSRVFGSINTDTIVGTAEFRFVPVNDMLRL